MAIPVGAILTAAEVGMQAYSALSAKKGQEDANRSQMEFNSMEAQKQRDFERFMFENRYQMTRKDLEAAGYNPLLATGLNPGTPAGAAAHAEPKSTRAEMAAILANSAKMVSEVNLTRSMEDKVKAETQSARAIARLHEQEAEIATSKWGKRAAAFRYFMEKTGIGRGVMAAAGMFSAAKAASAVGNFAKATRGAISFGKGSFRKG